MRRPDVQHIDPVDPIPQAVLVQRELERLLGAADFAGAQAHQRLLRHLVERTLQGHGGQLKETMLAIEVFQRPADRFDPKSDSIVRVEARRLRERLRRHYAGPRGRDARLVIDLPKGSYRPSFTAPEAPPVSDAEVDAAELIERGLFFLREGHEDGHRKALARFTAAALKAPGLAAAHSGVARAWVQLVATNIEPPRPGIVRALEAVRRALQIDHRHADSLVLAAQLTHRFEFDWPAARALFERAAQVEPGSAFVRHAHAFSLMMRGDFEAADTMLAHARTLDPMHLGLRAHQALLALYRRDWAAAETSLLALLDMAADNVLGTSLLGSVALLRGDAAQALTLYQRVAARHPRLSIGAAGAVQALAALGRLDEARAALQRLQHEWQGHYLSPYQLAMCEVRLDGPVQALAWLQRAVDEGDPNALCLPVDPSFDALRADPRAAALVARVLG